MHPSLKGRIVKKGETYELRADLNSEYKQKRKETVKKVIANMTIGKDVSSLFADVVKNMQTEDLELKKLVYLYLINYAKTNPELVILAVNTFVKDTSDHNPLIRALAIRTMGCLRVEKIIDYLMDPLKTALVDKDPYVRKTAALCVAKLYDLNPSIAVDNGLVAILQEMLGDGNPSVISNAVAALTEINDISVKKDVFTITNNVLVKLLAALNECTEYVIYNGRWGQICILSSLASYVPVDAKEASEITERVIPRLQHANASVVLSAVKVLMVYMAYIPPDNVKTVSKKLAPPLVTLLSEEAEVQYVALRNINLILQKRPDILNQEMRVFFTKYNDPLYIKLEKLEVIIRLANESNIDQVLSELKEYANEVDVEFVRKSVKSIGRCAIKIDCAAEKCVNVLLELIRSGVGHVVQECIVVIKDIFRKYPNRYEAIIPSLCENLESLDEPEAKASLIWIIGEYADRIENAAELIAYFSDSFKDEVMVVQLQLLTAVIKVFLKRPGSAQGIVNNILQTATQLENPDIRDRAYVYWRLLSSSPEAAKRVVMADKPPIVYDGATVSESLLDELIRGIASLASVYHVSPGLLGAASAVIRGGEDDDPDAAIKAAAAVQIAQQGGIGDLLDLGFESNTSVGKGPAASAGIDDLLGLVDLGGDFSGGMNSNSMGGMNTSPLGGVGSMGMNTSSMGGMSSMGMNSNLAGFGTLPGFVFPATTVLSASDAAGLQVKACSIANFKCSFSSRNSRPFIDFTFTNTTPTPMSEFATQFNVNTFGLVPTTPLNLSIPPNQSATASQELSTGGEIGRMNPINNLQIAVKNQVGVYYFAINIPLHVLFNTAFDNVKGGEVVVEIDAPNAPSVLLQNGFVQHGGKFCTSLAGLERVEVELRDGKAFIKSSSVEVGECVGVSLRAMLQ